MNKAITVDQSDALGESLKYIQKDFKEICFADNGLSDKQFASLLAHIMTEEKLYNDLQKINYAHNELGPYAVEALQ